MVKRVGTVAALLALLWGCAATRFLKEGQTYYAGSELQIPTANKVPGKNRVKSMLRSYITTKPTYTFLGSRPSAWFYFIAGTPKKQRGFRYFVKNKLGKKPVLLEDVNPDRTSQLLENELQNEGYFQSDVWSEVKRTGHRSKVIYTIDLKFPFHLNAITYRLFDTQQDTLGKRTKEVTLIKEGQRYSLDRLQAEQNRIEVVAQNSGYYYFDDRYLLFEADSTIGNRKIDLDLIFEPQVPDNVKRKYTVGGINIFPNYSLRNDSLSTTGDTTRIKGYNYIDNLHEFRPEIITNVINLRPDSVYRKIDHEYTLSRLMSLNAFKFVNVKFTESVADSSLFANIYITPLQKNSLRLQVQGVSKSNNFVGPGVEATFTNRNFLRGAELFQFKLSGAYESQISSQQAGALNSLEFGAEASLSVPRFITPIHIPYRSAKYLPQTQFKVGYNFQQRIQYFKLTSFNAGYGYSWRETTLKTHELFPIDLTFVQSGNTSAKFDSLVNINPVLKNSFQNQFIPGMRYSFTLNTQLREDIEQKYKLKGQNKSNFYFNFNLALAGNALNLLQSVSNRGEQPHTLFGSPYSQYIRGEIDFRYYLQLDKHQKLATRLSLGTGYAFGNSTQLPYIKQFAIGGSNSIRAFPARSIGPGTYNVRSDPSIKTRTYFIDQRGDLKLEGNVEYRFDMVKALKGAVFMDAGNIWLMRSDVNRPGAQFNKDTFLKQLAVGTGFGLRYDFSFFVLRFDAAFPIRKPYLAPSDRWVFDEIDFGSSDWRKKNIILNIAIGYPF